MISVFCFNSKINRYSPFIQNLLVSFFSLAITLLLIELGFAFYAQSDGFNHTLASQNWFARYWHTNSLGYRDREWSPELLETRTKIMVLGDSFAAGHGIKYPKKRFSNVLGQMLGQEYAVMNVAKNGAGTKKEIRMALNYPHYPDIVILPFYINDIHDTAHDTDFTRLELETTISPGLASLIENSYAFNFLYWRVYRLGANERNNNYWDWLQKAYQNPVVWDAYRSELLSISHFAKERNLPLIVVIFPNLLAPEESVPITAPIIDLFARGNIAVLDVGAIIKEYNTDMLVVNSVDQHPSEFLHRLVAQHLYPMVLNTHAQQ